MLSRVFCLFVVLLAIPPLQAAEVDNELNEARNIFLQGVDGDKHAVRNAVQRFRTLSLQHPDDPVFLAYLGASITLQGRDAQNNINKKRLTEEGLFKIDQALKQQSSKDDKNTARYLDTLLVASNTFIHIPSFFNRYDRGKQLLHEILDHPDFDQMAPGYKAAAYLAAALLAQGENNEEEYRQYLELTVDTDPKGRDGRSASELLEELEAS